MPARFPMYDFLLPVLLMPIEQDTDAGIAYRRAKCRQDEKGNRKPYPQHGKNKEQNRKAKLHPSQSGHRKIKETDARSP